MKGFSDPPKQVELMIMDDKITIIEGPPPSFDEVFDGWVLGLNESPNLAGVAVTRLRTFNGPALIERCYRAWNQNHPMTLEYRAMDGLDQTARILAARAIEVDDGQMVVLWVKMNKDDIELEIGYDDSDENED